MAYTSCITSIADSIAPDCAHPITGGYTGRAILIPLDENPSFTVDVSNPRILTAIAPSGANKFVAIDNQDFTDKFAGTVKALNADGGIKRYQKTVSFSVPLRGAAKAKDIVEPLVQSGLGFAIVLEKQDRVGDGSFEVYGYLNGLKVNADGYSQDETALNGSVTLTMSCVEAWEEVVMLDTDYATTAAEFETMLAACW